MKKLHAPKAISDLTLIPLERVTALSCDSSSATEWERERLNEYIQSVNSPRFTKLVEKGEIPTWMHFDILK